MALQLRRGTEAERTAGGGIVFAEGELVYITDTEEVYVGDGVTPGGIRVTGSISGSPAQLTQNLSMNGYNITGTGNININGTITATSFGGGLGGGIVDGQEYFIDIQGSVRGADSSIIVDSDTGIVYADFIGDGSLITGITVSSLQDTNIVNPLGGQILTYDGFSWINSTFNGITEGQTYDINISGNVISSSDSSVVIDSATGIGTFLRTFAEGAVLRADGDYGTLNMRKTVTVDLTGSNDVLGGIYFDKDDINGVANTAFIVGAESYIAMAANPTGTMSEADHVLLSPNGLGVGTYAPGAKLDVRGTGAFTGAVTLSSASLKLADLRAYTDITSPTVGEVMYDNVQSTIMFRTTSGWNKVIYSEVNTLLTQVPGPIVIGGVTNADLVAADDSAISGLMAYDIDNDRFTFYQAGSFVNLPNNGSTIGEVLKWNGTEWAAAPESGGVAPGSNADFLDGFDGTYYLNYNNFTNTPALATIATSGSWNNLLDTPTNLAGYGITDAATSAQGALADTAVQPGDLFVGDVQGSVFADGSETIIDGITGKINAPAGITLSGIGGSEITIGQMTISDSAIDTALLNTLGLYAGADLQLNAETNVTITSAVNGTSKTWDFGTDGTITFPDASVQSSAFTGTGNITFSGSVIDSSDSSGITITPAVTVSSDLTVENDLRVTNVVYADRFESTSTGTPEITAAANLNLTAGNAVVVTSSPLRMASFTTAERDALAAQNGDIIYNTTDNKFQGYENGAWVNLI